MRSAARFYAVQALFQMEAADTGLDTVLEEFETHRHGAEIDGATYAAPDLPHFRSLMTTAVTEQARIDQLTHHALVARWPIERIDPTLRALFRAAGAELVAAGAPPKVTIYEYLEEAKAFYPDGKEAKFVNAVLDHMAPPRNHRLFHNAPMSGGSVKGCAIRDRLCDRPGSRRRHWDIRHCARRKLARERRSGRDPRHEACDRLVEPAPCIPGGAVLARWSPGSRP